MTATESKPAFKLGDTVKVTANAHKGKRVILDHPAWNSPNKWWIRLPGQPVLYSVESIVDESDMEPVETKA